MKIFVGSSSEANKRQTLLNVCSWIEQLGHEPCPWTKAGLFPAGKYIFQRIIEISKSVDAAIFIFAEDDKIWYRGDLLSQARDNVMIEYGLFAGSLDSNRVIFCVEGGPRTPSDLLGIKWIDISQTKHSTAQLELGKWLDSIQEEAINSERMSLSTLFSFKAIISEFQGTLDRLEASDAKLAKEYSSRGDRSRLLDGLYSGLLYASGSVVTGEIDPLFYGNLLEWDEPGMRLRVKYFAGPYNENIITREFPIGKGNEAIAVEAFRSGEIMIINDMVGQFQLIVKGERLRAMMSIPIMKHSNDVMNGSIVILDIDSGKKDVFPTKDKLVGSPVQKRVDEITNILRRVNSLRVLLGNDI